MTWVHQSGLVVSLQRGEQMEQDLWCLHLFSPVLNECVLAEHGSLTTTSEAVHSLSGTSVLLLPGSNPVYSSDWK